MNTSCILPTYTISVGKFEKEIIKDVVKVEKEIVKDVVSFVE